MITIATYDNAAEAYIAKGLLENCGIRCMVCNDNVAIALPLQGAIELQVHAEDSEKARQILEGTLDDES